MVATSEAATVNFNKAERIVEGWYWLLRSRELKRGQIKPITLMGRDLAVYRGKDDGKVVALDAYCPHMGAHLAEGKVEGNAVRCFFHAWKFEGDGQLSDIPCHRDGPTPRANIKSWPVEERYGLIWLWTGETPRHPVPFVPELAPAEHDATLGKSFTKACHPNVMMINAIDQQHFRSVHMIPNILDMQTQVVNENCIEFANQKLAPTSHWFGRFVNRFYSKTLTYALTYWYGHSGIVTLGPDFLHFYIVFSLRQNADGGSDGQTILVTKQRRGVLGWIFNRVLLFLTQIVGSYFAQGDTRVFKTIKFDFQTPVKSDKAIVDFVRHYDKQRTVQWREDGSDSEEPVVNVRFHEPNKRRATATRATGRGLDEVAQ